jgi:hypothetical protein
MIRLSISINFACGCKYVLHGNSFLGGRPTNRWRHAMATIEAFHESKTFELTSKEAQCLSMVQGREAYGTPPESF